MDIEPIEGKALRFPPGRVEVRLDEGHRLAYRRLYQRYRSFLTGMPVLRERDFDGRSVKMSQKEFSALNEAFRSLAQRGTQSSVFDAQERSTTGLFKKTQFLS